MGIEEQLTERIQRFDEIAANFQRKARRLSWARFISFLSFAGLFIYGLSSGFNIIILGLVLLSLVGFITFIVAHKSANLSFRIYTQLSEVNHEEIKRSKLDLSNFEEGNGFMDEHHPYAYDLDIFGRHSVYQLLSRCTFHHSKDLLAKWLLKRAKVDEIKERQTATAELAEKVDFRHQLAAEARVSYQLHEKEHPEEKLGGLFTWMKSDVVLKNAPALYIISIIMVIANVSAMVMTFIDFGNYGFFALSFFVSLLILGVVFSVAKELGDKLNSSVYIIEAYVAVLKLIEKESFDNPYLQSLQAKLLVDQHKASESIRELKRIVYRFSSRASMFYILIDGLFMIDYYLVYSAMKWKKAHADKIHDWLDVVHEIETLSSVAGFYHLNKNYHYPAVANSKFEFDAKQLGHPLIPKNVCQVNDFKTTGEGEVNIITGSNMSGKSTFERTLGVNMVLAQMGAPVFAESLSMSTTDVFTSMRTKDNLEESTSSFYAELKRIKQLLEHVEESESTFYVLDEILKGTNSDDRHKGAIALANQLSEKRAYGLISTHDLALSELEKENQKIRNYSFNSIIKDDDIIFDYKLTDGPCKSFNASKLMEKMGIIVNN